MIQYVDYEINTEEQVEELLEDRSEICIIFNNRKNYLKGNTEITKYLWVNELYDTKLSLNTVKQLERKPLEPFITLKSH
ncbi:hypothetical protein IMZ31_24320 (plasmid) [Pontibacillus sp. ALD_SL1]|uniref:hypothetical protein n=1 Tax=Pontibacillus sp. ALD_SL1 TaxID=2777185 RepID=UPI001A96E81F|nr:hypothetical protein [Pontibacillus sp. ALD_SL1]QST02579.1 hypothetical protein IMZ31_24320 [Pontibacillus sp. ALD_SL1]